MIKETNELLYDYKNLGIDKGDTYETKIRLKVALLAVDDDIALAKAAWSAHQLKKIHSMQFNPEEVCDSVRVLSGVDRSHHTSPTTMRMLIPNGELVKIYSEHFSIFGPQFHRVFNNHRPID